MNPRLRSPKIYHFYLLYKYLYVVICFTLCILYLFHAIYNHWIGDFWEHAAVINELIYNYLRPKHPLFGIPTSHPFFSPYSLLLAGIAKILHLTALDILRIFGLLNLIIFLIALRLPVVTFCNDSKQINKLTLLLLLFLFLWPLGSYNWSGFFLYWIFILRSALSLYVCILYVSFIILSFFQIFRI